MTLDKLDRRIIAATQSGLPLTPRPYGVVAAQLNLTEDEVIARMDDMQARGIIRRIALAPNHYTLGMVANGMSVWDVDDTRAVVLGEKIGALPFVSHSYLRPRAEGWPYSLFAMIHGSTRDEVEEKRQVIATILGDAARANDILYSTRILKKTGMRISGGN
jgi:DNA-binding Lrp family transcriptional regulator